MTKLAPYKPTWKIIAMCTGTRDGKVEIGAPPTVVRGARQKEGDGKVARMRHIWPRRRGRRSESKNSSFKPFAGGESCGIRGGTPERQSDPCAYSCCCSRQRSVSCQPRFPSFVRTVLR